MQVSTGNIYPSIKAALDTGVPMHDLVEVRATRLQADEISRVMRHGHAAEAKKAVRRQAQRSRRANR